MASRRGQNLLAVSLCDVRFAPCDLPLFQLRRRFNSGALPRTPPLKIKPTDVLNGKGQRYATYLIKWSVIKRVLWYLTHFIWRQSLDWCRACCYVESVFSLRISIYRVLFLPAHVSTSNNKRAMHHIAEEGEVANDRYKMCPYLYFKINESFCHSIQNPLKPITTHQFLYHNPSIPLSIVFRNYSPGRYSSPHLIVCGRWLTPQAVEQSWAQRLLYEPCRADYR